LATGRRKLLAEEIGLICFWGLSGMPVMWSEEICYDAFRHASIILALSVTFRRCRSRILLKARLFVLSQSLAKCKFTSESWSV